MTHLKRETKFRNIKTEALLEETYLEVGRHRLPTVNELIKQHNIALAEKRLQQLYFGVEQLANEPATSNMRKIPLTISPTFDIPCNRSLTPDQSSEEEWRQDNKWASNFLDTKRFEEYYFNLEDCGIIL